MILPNTSENAILIQGDVIYIYLYSHKCRRTK